MPLPSFSFTFPSLSRRVPLRLFNPALATSSQKYEFTFLSLFSTKPLFSVRLFSTLFQLIALVFFFFFHRTQLDQTGPARDRGKKCSNFPALARPSFLWQFEHVLRPSPRSLAARWRTAWRTWWPRPCRSARQGRCTPPTRRRPPCRWCRPARGPRRSCSAILEYGENKNIKFYSSRLLIGQWLSSREKKKSFCQIKIKN